jgi:hypothetical protein
VSQDAPGKYKALLLSAGEGFIPIRDFVPPLALYEVVEVEAVHDALELLCRGTCTHHHRRVNNNDDVCGAGHVVCGRRGESVVPLASKSRGE